jgi:hypothetical protein
MAEPLGRGLRAARRSGLTRPEPVRTPTAPAATRTPSRSPEPRTSRTAGERQDARARNHLAKRLVQESSRKRATGIGRWIEPKAVRQAVESGWPEPKALDTAALGALGHSVWAGVFRCAPRPRLEHGTYCLGVHFIVGTDLDVSGQRPFVLPLSDCQ